MKTDIYLTELGVSRKNQSIENCYDNLIDKIKARFTCWRERRKYFITSYDTYNFDVYMVKQLYAGLRRYVECCEDVIVLEDENCLFEWQGQNIIKNK